MKQSTSIQVEHRRKKPPKKQEWMKARNSIDFTREGSWEHKCFQKKTDAGKEEKQVDKR